MMQCAWCRKPVRIWQKTKPLGCGYLKDTFGQQEHNECSEQRRKMIEEGHARSAVILARARLAAAEAEAKEQ